MDAKRSYDFINKGKFAGDYSRQEKALDGLNAADGLNSLSYTIWTYCPDSLHKWGDGWNVEDLSLWSEDDVPQQLQRTDVARQCVQHAFRVLLEAVASKPKTGASSYLSEWSFSEHRPLRT